MKKLKILSLILALTLVVSSFAACNKSGDNESDKENIEEVLPEKGNRTVKLNQTFKVADTFDITIESAEWLETINPSNTDGNYRYYPDVEGEKFFVLRGKIANNADKEFKTQEFLRRADVTINDKYTYQGPMEVESSAGKFTASVDSRLKAKTTQNLVVYASVMDQAYTECNKIRVKMYIVNDINKPATLFGNNDYTWDEITLELDMK